MLISLDMIKHKLAEQVDGLVPRLFPNARPDGPHWRLGSLSGEPGQSLAINRRGRYQGQWQDFASGERGTMLDLVAHALCGGDVKAAIQRSRELTGLGGLTADEMRKAEREAGKARARAEQEAAEAAARVQQSTQRIFYYESKPLPGTPAEAYLAGRGIWLGEMGGDIRALRYHPGLMHPETQALHPCMVALVMGIDGEARGIHRTFLARRPDGSMGKLTGVNDAKLSLGRIKGGHIPLWRGSSGKPMAHMPAGEWIVLTEGIEDALSVAYEMPNMRVWAGISLANMGGIELPAQCGGVWWHRHRDNETATAAAERAIGRLQNAGVAVRDVYAPGTAKDFNEARQEADRARWAASGAEPPCAQEA
jgi:hypothetical protein